MIDTHLWWNRGLKVWSDMERRGFLIDPWACEKAGIQATAAAEGHLERLNEWSDKVDNWNSPVQLATFLYDYKNLPIPKVIGSLKAIKINRQKVRSTSQASLTWLKENTNVRELESLLRYRACSADATRVLKLSEYADSSNRIHSVMGPTTDTGRGTSKLPALQQIPSAERDQFGIRNCFIAAEGNRLVIADYSQLELYVLAHYLIRWFKDDRLANMLLQGDVHSNIAREAWPYLKKYPGKLDKRYPPGIQKHRSDVKSVVYGVMYGKTAPGLGASIFDEQGKPIGTKKAQELIDLIYESTGMGAYRDAIIAYASRHGFIGTLGGRRRPIPEAQASDIWERRSGERQAQNSPIQGGAADIVTQAMINCDEAELPLVMQVHDELILEVPEERAQWSAGCLDAAMTSKMFGLTVPLKVDVHVVNNWGEAK